MQCTHTRIHNGWGGCPGKGTARERGAVEGGLRGRDATDGLNDSISILTTSPVESRVWRV